MPKVTGQRGIQIWVPVAPGYTYADTRGWVEKVSRAVGATVPELVSWEWTKDRRRRPGPAGLHAEHRQQDAGRAVERAAARRRAGVGADHLGRARRPRPAPRTAGRSATSLERVREAGDPLGPLIGRAQKLPSL